MSKANEYIVKWHLKSKPEKSRTTTAKGINAVSAKHNFFRDIGGKGDVVIESIKKA